jgi:hypothetical protein
LKKENDFQTFWHYFPAVSEIAVLSCPKKLQKGLALEKEFISSFFFRKRKKQRKLVADVQFMRSTHQT